MSKAIILSRVSTLQQDLTQQTEEVLKEVYKDGYKDKDIIVIEDKESAIKLSEEERMGLNKMKEHINNDPTIDAVYLYELSRLSRRQLVLFSIRDYLVERHIQLICLKPYFKLLEHDGTMSQTGSLMFSIFSSMSESEMMLKQERMLRGRKHNIAMGKSGGGRPPFGYVTDKDKRYIIEPRQSQIIKRIFNEYVNDGKSIWRIAQELKEEGEFPNTNIFTLNCNVSFWLRRKCYLGESHYPQIISKSMFDRAQIELKRHNRMPKKSRKSRFLLKGLIRDGKSGRMLSGQNGIDAYTMKYESRISIKRKNVDPIVWEYAKKMYRKYVMNKTVLRRQLQKDLMTISKKIETVKTEIQSIKDKVDKVEVRMIFGKLSSKKGEELIDRLSEEHSDKQRRLLELMNESVSKQQQITDVEFTEDFNESSLTLEEQIAIIKRIVKKIIVIRPTRNTAHIKIHNHINDIVTVYEVKCWNQTFTLIDEYRRKDER